MKKVLLALGLLALLVRPASAETVTIDHQDHGHSAPLTATVHDPEFDNKDMKVGFKADAPSLVQLTTNTFVGAEVSAFDNRDMVFHQSLNDNEVVALVKVTYTGTL